MDDLLKLDVAIPDMAEVLTEVCEHIYCMTELKLLCIINYAYIYNF